jgi:hypothetical protein
LKIIASLLGLLISLASLEQTACAAQQASVDPCAGSPSVGGNRFGASAGSTTETEVDVNLTVCWGGPTSEHIGIGFATYSLEIRDQLGNLVATIVHKGESTPGRAIYLNANEVYFEGVWKAQIPATITLQGTYNATAKQTFFYLLPGQTKASPGTLISAPFQVVIP